MDFLDFVQDDFHWFSTIIIQMFLLGYAYLSRIHTSLDITLSLVCVILMLVIDAFLVGYIFFSTY